MDLSMRIKNLWLLSVCIIVTMDLFGSVERDRDVQLLATTDQSCVFQFSPVNFRLDTLNLNDKIYQKAQFHLVSYTGEPGAPMVPCRIISVGIPALGGVNVTVSKAEFVEKQGIRLLPMPTLTREDNLPGEDYSEGPVYQRSGYLPGPLFEVDEPEMFGDQRIIRIKVYPVQFDARENTIRQYTEMVFQIAFEGRTDEGGAEVNTGDEEIYRRTLVNYSQVKRWRINYPRKPRRKANVTQAGEVYKIQVSEEGLYQVSGSFLTGQGIDIGSIQPSTIKVYNNGGSELPRGLSTHRADSLIENPVLLFGMEDGRFDASDYFLFYGKGVTGWEYDPFVGRYKHYINHYTGQNTYWFVFNDGSYGQRISTVTLPSYPEPGVQAVTTFRDLYFYEQDITNHMKSGIHWGGPLFTAPTSTRSFDLQFNDTIISDTLRFHFRFMGAALGLNQFQIRLNEQTFKTVQFSGTSQSGGPRINFSSTSAELSVASLSGSDVLTFMYLGLDVGSKAYLDWFEVEYGRSLEAHDGKLRFYSPVTEGRYEYRLSGFGTEPIVLDVTHIEDIRRFELRSDAGNRVFVDSVRADEPRDYISVESSAFLTPEGMQRDEGSDLRDSDHHADLVIITHSDFYDQALRLQAMREEHDSLSVFVADIQDIYDDFSWGLFDPTAIRDFVKYAYENWSGRIAYLLLFGDGDYDYRNYQSTLDKNWIPPFEHDGTTESTSRATDDWYTYVSGNDTRMDLAVGRLPVQTPEEARAMVDKIIGYETDPVRGDWRHLITMVGDDEKAQSGDENEVTHTRATEVIAENIIPQLFNFKKIYLTEYPEEITVEGRRKPAAREDLVEQINQGTLLVNFVGHGNEHLWAHERVFDRQTVLPLLQNQERFPFFYAATCAFGLFDNPEEQSFTEDLINAEGKGAIGVIAATRFCNAAPNEALNKAFMSALFSDHGPTLRVGDAMRMAKLNTYSTVNNEMYHIFGDPTMRLGVPRYRAVITDIEPDTLKALSLISVAGKLEKNGGDWMDFSGRIDIKAFDSKKVVVYTTQYGTQLSYLLPGNAIFRGEAQAENGDFQISFIMPKDIFYGGHTGRITCYYWNEEADGGGYWGDIEIGGSSDLEDARGPDISLYFEGREDFVTGGMISGKPKLVAGIVDNKSGINITGEIGHKIILTLDGEDKTDVTDYFHYDQGSYLQGKIHYPLSDIESGEHELNLKAWDNANNSSEQSILFRVTPQGKLLIEEVLNYPNPFHSSTHFTFQLNLDADVTIKVFTVDGRLLRQFDSIMGEPGFNLIPWDGRDDMGDELANGVYLYKIIARAHGEEEEMRTEVIGRCMVMR